MPRIRKTKQILEKDEKLRIINHVVIDGESARQVALNENTSAGMLKNWIKRNLETDIPSLKKCAKTYFNWVEEIRNVIKV